MQRRGAVNRRGRSLFRGKSGSSAKEPPVTAEQLKDGPRPSRRDRNQDPTGEHHMTARFCGSCGTEVVAGARFCASCGRAVAGPAPAGATAAPTGAGTPYPDAGPSYAGAPHVAAPGAPYPNAASTSYPDGPAAQAPGPYSAAPAGAPWGSASGAPSWTPKGTSGRSVIDSLLAGDWGGAARTAGMAVAVMVGVSLVGMLLITGAEAGFRETVTLVLGAVCAAVGGDIFAGASGGDSFGGSVSVGVLPLTVTFAGLGVLGRLFATRLRSREENSTRELLLQGIRTTLVFAGFLLVLSLLTRYRPDSGNEVFGVSGQIGVSVWSSVIGAVLFSVATLGLVWLFSPHTVLPGRLRPIREKAVAPLIGAAAVFAVGLLAVLVALVYGLITGEEKMVQLGVAVLCAGNGALASVLLSAGVPLSLNGGISSSVLGGGLAPSSQESIDLFTFTDSSAWFWFVPVVLLLVLLSVATVLALRQNSIEDARREGFRFAGALAVLGLAASLLLRVAGEFAGSAVGVSGSGDASAIFNPIVSAFALGVWGVVVGLLAPVVGTRISSGLVGSVRGRFGTASSGPVAAESAD